MTESTGTEQRHAGWVELFYDLLFVVFVAQLAHPLTNHPTWTAALTLLVLFLPAWWVWVGSTLYTNLTGDITAARRVDVLVQMAILLVLAASAPQAVNGHPALFACAYAASRVDVVVFRLLVRGKWPVGGANWPLLVSAALWVGSIFLHPPLAYLPWLVGLVVEIVPWVRPRPSGSEVQQRLVSGQIETTHLIERFGSFMIIVLGEAIAQIVASIAGAGAGPSAVITGVAAFVLVAMLWWLYFDFGSSVAERALGARPAEAFRLTRSIFMIGHFFLVVALVALAAGLGGLVTAGAHGQGGGHALILCVIALGVYLVNNATVGLVGIRYSVKQVLRWLLPNLLALVVFGLFGENLPPLVPLLVIAVFLSIETVPKLEGAFARER
ncbi:MAG TPA: low temperature requirement protein A [Pseudonocardiaceae bacterium]|nr:low temperature requirement protein A [Pseudonocardiaceae bacterium]